MRRPARRYSDSLPERLSEVKGWRPQDHRRARLERGLGLKIPQGSLQNSIGEPALSVADDYAQPVVAPAPAQDTILVVTADGKGIPMTGQDSPPLAARRGKGPPKTAQTAAVGTALSSVAPSGRASHDVGAALLPDQTPQPTLPPARPGLSHQPTVGTVAGKKAAINQLAAQVAQRAPPAFSSRRALGDGSVALPPPRLDHFPALSLVLEIIQGSA